MDWQTKRKIIYAFIAVLGVISITLFLARGIVFPEPTCSDMKHNGYELGVDCGGLCDKKCTQEVIPLSVLWSLAIPVATSTYDVVGLVSNANIDNAAKEVGYTFRLFNANGEVITTIGASTTPPLDGRFPIIVQNVVAEERPVKVELTLSDTDHYRVAESPVSPTVTITDRRFENGNISRLYAKVTNNKRLEIRDLEVRAVLFDSFDNAYAVGKTIIPVLDKEEARTVIFTWPYALKEEPTRIGIYPIFDPFDALVE